MNVPSNVAGIQKIYAQIWRRVSRVRRLRDLAAASHGEQGDRWPDSEPFMRQSTPAPKLPWGRADE